MNENWSEYFGNYVTAAEIVKAHKASVKNIAKYLEKSWGQMHEGEKYPALPFEDFARQIIKEAQH